MKAYEKNGLMYLGVSSVLAMSMTVSMSAYAQGLEEIVVFAQKRDQSLQDVPIVVSVITGADLEGSNITTLHDVSARLPNVNIAANPLTDFINIRGVGSGQNAGFEQAVGTFVDGFYRGRSRSTKAALFDVAQVEVLKGPQTTYFGNNTVAGALNITTREPGNEFEANVSALYGEYGEHNLEGAVTLPVSEDLSVRLAIRQAGLDGYSFSRTTNSKFPERDETLGRVSIKWDVSDVYTTKFRYDRGTNDTQNYATPELINCPPPAPLLAAEGCGMFLGFAAGQVEDDFDYNGDGNYTFLDYEFEEAGWTNTWDFDSFSLVSATGYFHHDLTGRANLLPTPVPGTPSPWAFQNGNPWGAPNPTAPLSEGYLGAPSPIAEETKQYSQELRLQSSNDGDFDWMVGAYYSKAKTNLEADFGFWFLPFMAIASDVVNGAIANGAPFAPLTEDPWTPVTGYNPTQNEDETYSTFVSFSYRPSERLQFNVGTRYSKVEKYAGRNLQFGTSVDGDLDTFRAFDAYHQGWMATILGADLGAHPNPNRSDDDFMPSLGVQYELGDNAMVYGSYSGGFKAGGFSAASDIVTFGPETVDAYELGLKGTYLDGSLRLNVALFQSEYDDLQETVIEFVGGSPNSIVRNAAKATARGLEVGIQYQLTDNFTLLADIGFLDSSYDNYPSGSCTIVQSFLADQANTACSQNMSGKQRPYAPDYSGNIGAEYVLFVGEGELTFRPLLYITDSYFHSASADSLLKQDAYVKLDMTVGYQVGAWDFSVVGKNLTDKKTIGFSNTTAFGGGSVNIFPDAPRMIAGRIAYEF